MRYESSVTSLSWIPSEAVTGPSRLAFDSGFSHYDDPPPAELGDLEELRAADKFRFANVLRAWIEVGDDGQISDAGYSRQRHDRLHHHSSWAACTHRFQAVKLPDIQRPPEHGPGWVRFIQTVGGRTGVPMPRPVQAPPLRAVAGPAGVDHADADPARRRHRRARDDRGEHVPPALGLRRRRAR